MKTSFFSPKALGLTLFFSLMTTGLSAQWMTNGNTVTTGQFLGATNNASLAIRTNNLERMRVDATGKVGIGTGLTALNPATDLHLVKSASGGSFGTTSIFRIQAVNTTASFTGDNAYDFRVTSDGFLRLTQLLNGSSLQVLSSNTVGNVGIGVSSANAKLEVLASSRVSALGNAAKYVDLGHDGTNATLNSTEDLLVNHTSGRSVAIGNIGTNAANLTVSGNIGIGTATPAVALDVKGKTAIVNTATNGPALSITTGAFEGLNMVTSHPAGTYRYGVKVEGNVPDTKTFGGFLGATETFRTYANGNTYIGGNVGIGKLETSAYRLDVAGKIRACEVLVETNGWCDYVFEDNYDLRTIDELESYVKENKHLPNIPAASVVEAEGQSLGDYQKRMMEKIEELSLYVIELNHGVKDLNQKVQELEAENAQLKAEAQK